MVLPSEVPLPLPASLVEGDVPPPTNSAMAGAMLPPPSTVFATYSAISSNMRQLAPAEDTLGTLPVLAVPSLLFPYPEPL